MLKDAIKKVEVIDNKDVIVYRATDKNNSDPLSVAKRDNKDIYVSTLVLHSLPPTVTQAER